jgi:hypothetical protein
MARCPETHVTLTAAFQSSVGNMFPCSIKLSLRILIVLVFSLPLRTYQLPVHAESDVLPRSSAPLVPRAIDGASELSSFSVILTSNLSAASVIVDMAIRLCFRPEKITVLIRTQEKGVFVHTRTATMGKKWSQTQLASRQRCRFLRSRHAQRQEVVVERHRRESRGLRSR